MVARGGDADGGGAEIRIPIAAPVGPVVHLFGLSNHNPFNGHNRRLLNTLSEFTWYVFIQLIAWRARLAASTNCGSAIRCIHFQYGYFLWSLLFNTFSEDTFLPLLQLIALFALCATLAICHDTVGGVHTLRFLGNSNSRIWNTSAEFTSHTIELTHQARALFACSTA